MKPRNNFVCSALVATLALCCTFSNASITSAQSHPDHEVKTQKQLDIAAARANRKALVGANMDLTKEQAEKFWPLYDAYEAKMDRIEERHAAEVKAFAEHFQTLTPADADRKLDEVIAIRQARLDVQKEFVPKFRAAISSVQTTRFFQIDNKLNAMIQCDLAQALPLAKAGTSETDR
jgi:Spy/CpxP family protein refolding chaperone